METKDLKKKTLPVGTAADLMPTDTHSRSILKNRAKQLAKQEIQKTDTNEHISYIRFRLGKNEYYGIPYENAKMVLDNIELTKIPRAYECIAGVINHGGILLTVIDLKKFLHTQESENEENCSVIVVTVNNLSIGFLTDYIEGSNEYDKEMLNTQLTYDGVINTHYILGLHQGVTAILNVEAIISDLQQLLSKS